MSAVRFRPCPHQFRNPSPFASDSDGANPDLIGTLSATVDWVYLSYIVLNPYCSPTPEISSSSCPSAAHLNGPAREHNLPHPRGVVFQPQVVKRIHIEAIKIKAVTVGTTPDLLSVIDGRPSGIVEPCKFHIMIGASSKGMRLSGRIRVRYYIQPTQSPTYAGVWALPSLDFCYPGADNMSDMLRY